MNVENPDTLYAVSWDRIRNNEESLVYGQNSKIHKTTDGGQNWETISPDLTRNDISKQGPGGGPFTNEAAGGENYNTLMYLVESPHEEGVLWAGSDDGLVHLTRDGGQFRRAGLV